MARKGMGIGLGKGYKNIIIKDQLVHSMSAKGMKQKNPTIQITKSLDIKRPIIGYMVKDDRGNVGVVTGVEYGDAEYIYSVLADGGGAFTVIQSKAKKLRKATQKDINKIWENANPFAKDEMIAHGMNPKGIYRLKYTRIDDGTEDFEDYATKKEAMSWAKVRARDEVGKDFKIVQLN